MEYAQYIALAFSIIGVFAVIARFTKNKTDDKLVQFAYNLINFLAMNHGNAANKDES